MRKLAQLAASISVIGLAAAILSSCGTSSDNANNSPAPVGDAITFTDPWTRATAPGQSLGVVYMTINNSADSDDALLTVTVDASVASGTEVHQSYEIESTTTAVGGPGRSATVGLRDSHIAHGGGGHDDPHGVDTSMMGMREVGRIVVPANGSVTLEPAGYHIMLLDLAKPLVAGESYDLTMTFEKAGTKVVRVPILDRAP